jgi:hypothetical protein
MEPNKLSTGFFLFERNFFDLSEFPANHCQWESLIIQTLPKVNSVSLPRVVRLNPQTRGEPRR